MSTVGDKHALIVLLRPYAASLALPLMAITGAFVVSGLIIQLAGYDAPLALGALFRGALGSSYSLSETVVRSCPLLLTGLAVSFAFRCGVWNIGAEGQFLAGALAAAWAAPWLAELPGWLGVPLTLGVGLLAGTLLGGLAAFLKVWRNAQEVITTIMLNFTAIQLVSYAVHGPLMEDAGQFPQSNPIAEVLRLSRWLPPTRIHTGVILALVMVVGFYILLFHTVFGFRVRAAGVNPIAARAAGLNVPAAMIGAMGVSGAIAGLAGAVELTGVTYRLYEDFGSGYGYTAIGVALLGRLSPSGVVLAALLFAALETGASAMQRTANVSAVLVYVIQAMVLLFVVSAMAYERYRSQRSAA